MTKHRFGFGIVGVGMIAEFHARAIQAMDGAGLVACCSRRGQAAADFARRHGGAAYTDYAEFLAHDGLDVVAICTPSGAHLEPCVAAAAAG